MWSTSLVRFQPREPHQHFIMNCSINSMICDQDLILSNFQVTLDTATSFVIGWPITNAVITFRYVPDCFWYYVAMMILVIIGGTWLANQQCRHFLHGVMWRCWYLVRWEQIRIKVGQPTDPKKTEMQKVADLASKLHLTEVFSAESRMLLIFY